ncbi:MAG: uroporphyrinogen-III C-methyltransferase [Rhodobiaceae bacterium]|nr:uroporphyrinogen-III C-methyltransferase [Rhodobiaceae bacterium]MCC0056133.1 uroporphyrinogen-III C-methyltransferase [Rhodobiaceae bacterium]
MGALEVLPVFYQLKGRRVVVIGGTAAAAWKAELLAAAGAEIYLVAAILEDECVALVAGGSAKHVCRDWLRDDLRDAALIVADATDETDAALIATAARAAGIPVNVIDRPAFCDFQFGSIVNRSPVVIGISTSGAAPILGQAIRRRIETLIPPAIAGWAALAARLRGQISDRLTPGVQRRRFWERFVDLAFAGPAGEDADRELQKAAELAGIETGAQGRVTLVGAGPGDAELLTLKAVRALQAADVILFDDLVSDEVLELARREARRMLVGKRGGRESCRQDDINATMVKLARAGKNVVRLKSGDPMIFGRAGEELAELERHGISVSVVPGVTSAMAMAAQLGISLTHRDHAQQVRFVTGHSRKGELPEAIDWAGLADPSATTIFYMGGRMANKIADSLQAHGLSGETPTVICQAVTRPDERRWMGRLSQMPAAMMGIGVDAPVLIGVGAAFGVRNVSVQEAAPSGAPAAVGL